MLNLEKQAARHHRYTDDRRKAGICICCGIAARPLNGYKSCETCRENKRILRAKYKAQSICYCGREPKFGYKICQTCLDSQQKYRENHPEGKQQRYTRSTNRTTTKRKLLKLQIFEVYGNKCNCCGESTFEFLQIDHVFGGGTKHRKELGGSGGLNLYKWIVNSGFPPDFQLLCSNCNWSKGVYGYCPHSLSCSETELGTLDLLMPASRWLEMPEER